MVMVIGVAGGDPGSIVIVTPFGIIILFTKLVEEEISTVELKVTVPGVDEQLCALT